MIGKQHQNFNMHLSDYKPLLITLGAFCLSDINAMAGTVAIIGSATYVWVKIYFEIKKNKHNTP